MQILLGNLLSFIILIWQLISLAQGASTQWIFQQNPFFRVSVGNPDNSIQQIIETQSGLIFLAAGKEGLKIIDPKRHKLIQKIENWGEISKITTTSDEKFIFFYYNGYMSSFTVENDANGYQLKLIGQETSTIGQNVNYLYLMNDDKWAAAACNDLLVIYDISNRAELKLIGQISTGMNVFSVVLDKNSYLYVAYEFLKVVRYKEQNGKVILNIVLEVATQFNFSGIAITSDEQFIYALDIYSGLQFGRFLDLNLIADGSIKTDFQFDVTNWWPSSSTALGNNIILTKDENFALIGVNYTGILVFDISNRVTQIIPSVFQQIVSTRFSYSITLSKDEDSLYYSNGEEFLAFKKIQPNFNDDVPNIFNSMQANFTDVFSDTFYWRCYMTTDGSHLIGAFDLSGLLIFDLHNDPLNLQFKQQVQGRDILAYIDSAIIDEDNGYIITIGYQDYHLLSVFAISDIQSSTPLSPIYSLVYSENIIIEGITYNHDKSVIGIGAYNQIILVATSKGPPSMEVISCFKSNNNEFIELIFSNDDNYIVAASRNYGFASINIKDPKNPFIEFFLPTKGAFSITVSLDGLRVFAAEGPKGISILDISQLPMIIILGRLAIDGATFQVKPIWNDQFLLVSSQIVGFMSLVDARDFHHPIVIAKYGVNRQNGLASCANHEETFAFFLNHQGITSIPLRNPVQIHTELFRVTGIETQKIIYSQLKFTNSIFYVGQLFQMHFYQIYCKDGAKITNIFYYKNFEVVQLPNWITFQKKLAVLEIQVAKEALGIDIQQQVLNTLLIEHSVPLLSSAFLTNEGGVLISKADSIRIHSQLRSMGLIDFESFLITSKFERQEAFYFQDISMNASQPLLDKVKRILQQSVSYNPVRFKVAASLQFFENPTRVQTDYTNSDKQVFVFSLQTNVQLNLEIQIGDGKFVETYYEGVNAQISSSETRLNLFGPVININTILKNRILFFKISKDPIIFHLILLDGVNYTIEKDIEFEKTVNFIALKQTLYLNEGKSLQQQFNKQFTDGTVFIEESISFEFSDDTFLNPDTKVINYVASFDENGIFVDSLEGSWIQQSSNSLRFFGLIPANKFRTILRIKITASDGYTSVTDDFVLYIYGVPFVYIFSSFIKIFGPIFTMLGFYKYRSLFFNIAFRKYNVYKKQQVQVNRPFFKKFAIISDENIKAILLFQSFIQTISITKQNNSLLRRTPLKQQWLKENDQNIFDSQQIFSQPNENNESNQFINQLLQNNQKIKLILKQMAAELKPKNRDTYKDNNQNQSHIQKCDRKNEFVRSKTLVQSLMGDQNHVEMNELVQNMQHLQLTIRINNKQIKIDSLLSDLKEPTSRIHQALKAVASRYVLRDYPLLNLVYRFLRESAQLEFKAIFNSEKDWYSKYVRFDSEPNTTSQSDSLLLSFPSFSLDYYKIKKQLTYLEQLLHKHSKESCVLFNKQNLPLILLYDVIRADVLGLVESPPSVFSPSVGESIHLNIFNINSARAFKRADNLLCPFFRRPCDLDYMSYGPVINQQLPSWMNFIHKSSVIILSGTPQQEDVETFLVRIFDSNGYIIRQFQVEVIDYQSTQIKRVIEGQELSLFSNMMQKGDIIMRKDEKQQNLCQQGLEDLSQIKSPVLIGIDSQTQNIQSDIQSQESIKSLGDNQINEIPVNKFVNRVKNERNA